MRRWYQYPINQNLAVANTRYIKQQLFSQDYHFVVQKMTHVVTSEDYTIQIIQGNLIYQQSPVSSANVFGNIQYPNMIKSPIIFLKGTLVDFHFINGATAPNSVQICLEGYLTDEPIVLPLAKQWYQYPVPDFSFTATGQQGLNSIVNNAGYNFVIEKLVATKDNADFTFRMIDANILWQNDYAKCDNALGTAQRPNMLVQPIFMRKNASLQVQAINGTASATNEIQIVLEGTLIP